MSDFKWMVWTGPEIEGTVQGEQRLFVHELHDSVTTGVVSVMARKHRCQTVYFCAEHVQRHGMHYVRSIPEDMTVVVCMWPRHFEGGGWRVHPRQRTILEVHAPRVDEVKVVSADFTVACIDADLMPASKPSDYNEDRPLLMHETFGQDRSKT